MLIHFCAQHGTAKTEAFARKMIRNGQLTEADVAEARSQFEDQDRGN